MRKFITITVSALATAVLLTGSSAAAEPTRSDFNLFSEVETAVSMHVQEIRDENVRREAITLRATNLKAAWDTQVLLAAEAARVEAERVAAVEAARVEAERIETERVAAVEAARLEAERVAAVETAQRSVKQAPQAPKAAPAAVTPQAAQPAAPAAPKPYQWSSTVTGAGGQAQLDKCNGVTKFDVGVPIAYEAYFTIHNHCGGAPLLSLPIGSRISLVGMGYDGIYEIVASKDVLKGATTDELAGVSGQYLIQTCYVGNTMRVMGLTKVS